MRRIVFFVVAVLSMFTAAASRAQTPLDTAFTFQGELAAAGAPTTGSYDLRFRIFDAAAGGNQVGSTLCSDNLSIVNGRFTVSLDFGPAFAGQKRFLEVEVRQDTGLDCSDATGYTPLTPRQELTAAPNATFAQAAASATTASNAASLNGQSASFFTDAANLTGTLADARLSGNVARLNGDQTFTGLLNFTNAGNTFAGSGAGLTNLNGGSISSGTLARSSLSADVQSGVGTVAPDLWLAGSVATGTNPFSVAVSGSFAYVVNQGSNTLQVFNISIPVAITLAGSVTTGSQPVFVAASGSFAYVVNNGSNTLQVFNISNPAAPSLVGSIVTGGGPLSVAVSGSFAYVVNQSSNTLQVFNVSSPAVPTLAGSIATGIAPLSVAVSGSFAYVANFFSNALQVFNMSNPASPTLAGSVGTEINPSSVAVSGSYAYVVNNGSNALQAFNISDPAAPTLAGSIVTGGGPRAVAVSGPFAYVVNQSSSTLQVFNVTIGVGFGTPLASSDLAGVNGSGLTRVNATSLNGQPASFYTNASNITAGTLGTAQIPNLDASKITTGTLGTARIPNLDASKITTGTLANALTTGTDLSTPSTIVLRDASGNFAAGTITGALNGNATTATSATTATTATNAIQLNSQAASFYTNAANITTGMLANTRTTGTNLNSPSTLVLRDASGNFSAGTITAALNGNAASATLALSATNATQLNGQSGLYYTSASSLVSGTLADARLSSNIPLKNAANAFTSTGVTSFAGNVGVGAPAPIQTLDVNGRVNVANGVIQRGGAALTTTSDLGLYSQVSGNFMRFVTNNGEFHWYGDGGAGTVDRMILFPDGNLSVTGSLSKGGGSFKIDHPLDPENKYLYHSFVESPDMMNVYNGNVVTDANGYATITLPDYFDALNRDFRYSLTVIDENAPDVHFVRVASKISGNQFTVRSTPGNLEISWQVTGIRKDAWAEKNRIPNSVEKPAAEKGKYLHPEAFGKPAGQSIFSSPTADAQSASK